MGGNKENKRSTQLIDQERGRQLAEQNRFVSYAQPERDSERAWANSTRDTIMGGYNRLYNNASDPKDMFGGFDGQGGGSGGYSATSWSPITAQIERARAALAGLSGYSTEAAGGYRNFANTGGWSDNDIANFRDRAVRTSNAFYGGIEDEMRRAAARNGGGLAFTSSLDKLARKQAQAGQSSMTDAEIEMANAIRQGKLAGLSGLTTIGGQETDLNMFNSGQLNQVDMFNAGQGNEMNRFNTSILNENAASNAAAANSAAAYGAAAEERRRSDRVREYMMGLSGMQDMYGATPAELARQDAQLMQARFGTAGNIGDNLSLRVQNNPKGPSVMDRIMQGAGIVGGVAGAWMGGR